MAFFRSIKCFLVGSGPVIVVPFGGYADEKHIYSMARVLVDEGITETESDTMLKNLWNSIKRFESDEKQGVDVRVSWLGQSRVLTSDKEGYIYLETTHQASAHSSKSHWISVKFELLQDQDVTFSTTSRILLPPDQMSYGVISDVDDTILHTGVTSFLKWRLIVNSVLRSSLHRKAFDRVVRFFDQLHAGPSGSSDNPIFYLSNSPWNMFGYLRSFLENSEFPEGVLMMRDMGFEHLKAKAFTEKNKFVRIKSLLEFYPERNFILIGDAGEKDIDIYLEISRLFPDRILAIYIRTVKKRAKMQRIEQLIEGLDVNVKLFDQTQQAEQHAKAHHFIQPDRPASDT